MALPGAHVERGNSGPTINGSDLICVIAPAPMNADSTPRLFGSAAAIYADHGYGPGVEFAAQYPGPMLFAAVPINTPGAIGRENTSGNTGTCVTSLAAGGSGVLFAHEGRLDVVRGGTVGTDQIELSLSLDEGATWTAVRLGTATRYVIPYVGVTISFTTGTLIAGQRVHEWTGTSPRAAAADWSDVFDALAADDTLLRTIVFASDVSTDTEVAAASVLLEAYDANVDRYTLGRFSVLDRVPQAQLSSTSHRMSACNITFAEVNTTGDTITRNAGSWATDGFATGDILTTSGAAQSGNNKAYTAQKVTVTNATVITLGTDDLVDEGPVANIVIVGHASLTFAAAGDTCTRAGGTPGSWIDDGFRVGDTITVAGTASNNGTYTVTAVTDTVLTVSSGFADEVIAINVPTIVSGQSQAAWIAAQETEFEPVSGDDYVSIAIGCGRVFSPFSGRYVRASAAWYAVAREYSHDLHVATWRKSDGPAPGWLLKNPAGIAVEWDDRSPACAGAATAARFTCFRTYANGPAGAFLACDFTRSADAPIVFTHNAHVVNRAMTVCQASTEYAIGQSLITEQKTVSGVPRKVATAASRSDIEQIVNTALRNDLLSDKRKEGPRVSDVRWVMSETDDMGALEPTVTGTLYVDLRGTIYTINTTVIAR